MVNEGTRGRRFVIRVKLKVTLEGRHTFTYLMKKPREGGGSYIQPDS